MSSYFSDLAEKTKRLTRSRSKRSKVSGKPEDVAGGKWVLVPDEDLNETDKQRLSEYEKQEQERLLEYEMDLVMSTLSVFGDSKHPFAAADQFQDYFPGNQEIPKKGAWIMIKQLLPTEFTPPPLSFWFATPWPMEHTSRAHRPPHRAKIITPRGELGVFPHEYSLVTDPGKYWEFIGTGEMKACFFGLEQRKGIPPDALFYLRSRGISKRDAITMLVGNIHAHGVLWLETDPKVAAVFGLEWPPESKLATIGKVETECENPSPKTKKIS